MRVQIREAGPCKVEVGHRRSMDSASTSLKAVPPAQLVRTKAVEVKSTSLHLRGRKNGERCGAAGGAVGNGAVLAGKNTKILVRELCIIRYNTMYAIRGSFTAGEMRYTDKHT